MRRESTRACEIVIKKLFLSSTSCFFTLSLQLICLLCLAWFVLVVPNFVGLNHMWWNKGVTYMCPSAFTLSLIVFYRTYGKKINYSKILNKKTFFFHLLFFLGNYILNISSLLICWSSWWYFYINCIYFWMVIIRNQSDFIENNVMS